MPIYEYYCHNCNITFSRLVDKDEDFSDCPYCNLDTKKVPSICNSMTFKPTEEGETSRHVVTDQIKEYNDSEQASKTGKVRIY